MEKLEELYSELENKFANNAAKLNGVEQEIQTCERALNTLVVDEYSLESLREKKRLEDDLKSWKTIQDDVLKERTKLKELHGSRLGERVSKLSNEALTKFESQASDKYTNELEAAIAEVQIIKNKWKKEVEDYVEILESKRRNFVPFAEKIDHTFSSSLSQWVHFKIKEILDAGLRN